MVAEGVRSVDVQFRKKLAFESLDDYGHDHNRIWFQVLDTGVETYNLLILIHAVVEYLTATSRGIPLQMIARFDEEHKESDEPGDEIAAPYRNEHCLATGIERMLCAYLNIPWQSYEEHLTKALEVYKDA